MTRRIQDRFECCNAFKNCSKLFIFSIDRFANARPYCDSADWTIQTGESEKCYFRKMIERRISFSNINLARKNRLININFTKETLKLLWDRSASREYLLLNRNLEFRREHTLNNLNFNRIKRRRTGVKTEKSWRDGKDSPILTVCTLKLFCSNAVSYDHRPLLTRASCLHDRVDIILP